MDCTGAKPVDEIALSAPHLERLRGALQQQQQQQQQQQGTTSLDQAPCPQTSLQPPLALEGEQNVLPHDPPLQQHGTVMRECWHSGEQTSPPPPPQQQQAHGHAQPLQLNPLSPTPAYVLLVVDGTWRQAKEMFNVGDKEMI